MKKSRAYPYTLIFGDNMDELFEKEINKMRNLGEQLSKAEFLEIQGLVKEINKQKEVISDLVYEVMDEYMRKDEVKNFIIYDECLKVTLLTSTENAWRILEETNCKAVEEVEDVYENTQDEIYAIIGCAIDCINEIVSKHHEKNCSQICLSWGKEFCNVHSCKYFGDLLEASRLYDVRAQHLWKVISIEYVED
ncbi:MAG: hypothetical protein J6Y78_10780 [Paludibacteraceae bacterium]|nr:hypothetical protein [Paludibacteraceae bacterium]